MFPESDTQLPVSTTQLFLRNNSLADPLNYVFVTNSNTEKVTLLDMCNIT